MGKQTNKTIKRKRRAAYLKRRKAVVKATRKSASKKAD
jgi:hypothetical protein